MNSNDDQNTQYAVLLLCTSAWIAVMVFAFASGWNTESLCKNIDGCINAEQDYMPSPSKGNAIAKKIHFKVSKKTDIDKFQKQVVEIEKNYRTMGFVSKFMSPPLLDVQEK